MAKRPTGNGAAAPPNLVPAIQPIHQDFALLQPIANALVAAAGGADSLKQLIGELLRDCIDGVVKTPKTGRRFYDQLQNSEKTYIGTVVEIELRDKLALSRGTLLDLDINGVQVDVKFSASTSWMIPPEAIGHPCVLISANDTTARGSFGMFAARPEYLTAPNRDQKRGVSAAGRGNVMWLFRDEPYPQNFWQTVTAEAADRIADGRSGNERMMTLFREVLDRPISRKIVEDVASQRDFMRRLRADGARGTRDILAAEGILVLSGNWREDQELIQRLGLPALDRSEFMSHRVQPMEIQTARQLGFRV